MEQIEKYDHDLYKYVNDIKEADAVAYSWVNKEKAVFFPYKSSKLEDDEIRANILYAGLCHSDCFTVRSLWRPAKYPIAPGHEIIAEVSEVGKNITKFKKGDKVGFGTIRKVCDNCDYCKNNKEPLCQNIKENKFTFGYHWGGYSTLLQQPGNFFFKLPEKLDLARSAPLFCAGITVYNPIKQYVKKGMKAAVIGVGGLGHLAVQFLAYLGCSEVVGVTNSLNKEKFIKDLGATGVILSEEEDFKKNAGKFNFIINTLPVSKGMDKYLSLTAPGGYFCQVGVPDVTEKVEFCINPLVVNEIHLVGSLVGSRADIEEMLQICADNNIYPICEQFEFEDFDKAFDRLENGRPIFRCVVDCGKYSKKTNLFK